MCKSIENQYVPPFIIHIGGTRAPRVAMAETDSAFHPYGR